MPLKVTSHNFYSHSFNHSKMAEVKTSEVDAKPAPVSLGLSRVKFGNRGNRTFVVWQRKPYLCINGFHSWTHCLTTITMVVLSL
jgi:hypothetical protein